MAARGSCGCNGQGGRPGGVSLPLRLREDRVAARVGDVASRVSSTPGEGGRRCCPARAAAGGGGTPGGGRRPDARKMSNDRLDGTGDQCTGNSVRHGTGYLHRTIRYWHSE